MQGAVDILREMEIPCAMTVASSAPPGRRTPIE